MLQGFALAGVPAVAMAYLAEEVDRGSLGRAMGLFIAGNSIGGLTGRIAADALADHGGWRVALAGVGALSVTCAVVFALILPRSSHFRLAPPRVRGLLGSSVAGSAGRRAGCSTDAAGGRRRWRSCSRCSGWRWPVRRRSGAER